MRTHHFGNAQSTTPKAFPKTIKPVNVWLPVRDKVQIDKGTSENNRQSFRQRTFKATGIALGLGVAGLLGGIALMSTGPLGCLPGLLLLLATPVAAVSGGLFRFFKNKNRSSIPE